MVAPARCLCFLVIVACGWLAFACGSSNLPTCAATQACIDTAHGGECQPACRLDGGGCPSGESCVARAGCCAGAYCAAPEVYVCCAPSGC